MGACLLVCCCTLGYDDDGFDSGSSSSSGSDSDSDSLDCSTFFVGFGYGFVGFGSGFLEFFACFWDLRGAPID
ncbi:uncharacterized protein MELLADRAFT_56062, partial [Melampsora larici-populina 98AG31]